MKNLFKELLGLFLNLYSLSVVIFTIYFNWKFIQEHGVIPWIAFGELIATLKALIWPFFIFSR
jgi:hypothetical protein